MYPAPRKVKRLIDFSHESDGVKAELASSCLPTCLLCRRWQRTNSCCTYNRSPAASNKRTGKNARRPRSVMPGRQPEPISHSSKISLKNSCLGGKRYPLENFWTILKLFAAERIDSDPDETPLRCPAHRTRWLGPHLAQATSLRKGGSSCRAGYMMD